eukprot:TRINITY_DN13962_c0_g1_i1.p1 TRINITY_DN13962_c0_g1~~TRINITY_DN13962_c0_g1_i1.p1  ORF type:complete len:448 (-),score=43.12 TRINITY_DN13962_c0_g1_i1:31-1341(-)
MCCAAFLLLSTLLAVAGDFVCTAPKPDQYVGNTVLHAFGYNQYRQLGTGRNDTLEPLPVVVGPMLHSRIRAVSAGLLHTLVALESDGKALASGDGTQGQLGLGAPVTATDRFFTLEQVIDLHLPASFVNESTGIRRRVLGVTAGWSHSCILVEAYPGSRKNSTYCFGSNEFGQLGTSGEPSTPLPRPVTVSGVLSVSKIFAGGCHTLALTEDSRVFAWGRNDFGQIGQSSEVMTVNYPREVSLGSLLNKYERVVDICAGYHHSVLLTNATRLIVFGSNVDGQLGSTSLPLRQFHPAVLASSGWTEIACGGYHTLALDSLRRLYTWGDGTVGQTGQPTPVFLERWKVSVPTIVPSLTSVAVQSIAAGLKHSIVLDNCGSVYSFGSDAFGQLGVGGTTEEHLFRRTTPVAIPRVVQWGLDVVAISAGGYHSFLVAKEA